MSLWSDILDNRRPWLRFLAIVAISTVGGFLLRRFWL